MAYAAMRRAEAEVRAAEPLRRSEPASRLYIHDVSLTTRSSTFRRDDSLSSVSPSSSTRHRPMQSLSSHSSDDDVPVHHTTERRRQKTPMEPRPATNLQPRVAKAALFEDLPADELQHIKDSVERLRAQRMHVEQLRQRSERFELLLAERAKENEKLRLQVASLQGVEHENMGLLKSFQLLEERIRALEATCSDRKEDVRVATERVAAMEKARDTLQLRVDELSVEREHYRKQLGTIQLAHEKRMDELKATHERAIENLRRGQTEWKSKLQDLEQSQSHVERQFQEERAQLQHENEQLVREHHALEQHVQQLLATTVRQTTMIEDCDRLLSESKTRHANAKANYREQLKRTSSLEDQIKRLEHELATCEHDSVKEKNALEAKVAELETKNRKSKDKNDLYAVALQEKENLCEKLQQELLVRDRARFHVEDVVKELRQKEKTLLSEISSLKVALSDRADEKSILQDQLRGLQAHLEKERNDRSRWATARLKLLAEFCDEESKLNTALHPYSAMDVLVDEGLEEVLGDGFEDDGGNNNEGDDVDATVAAAGLKMDAMDRRLRSSSARPTAQQRPAATTKAIIFG